MERVQGVAAGVAVAAPDDGAPRRRDVAATVLALAGAAGAVTAVVLIGVLHLVAADQVDPVRRTISEYALGSWAPVFDIGVVALVGGTLAVAAAAVRTGMLRAFSGAGLALATWSLGLALVVVFEKTNWAVGPSIGGYIHRYASVVAFIALPIGALRVVAGMRGDAGSPRRRAWIRGLSVLSLAWFLPIVGGIVSGPFTGRQWWTAIPLGLIERGLALTEVVVVLALAGWALHRARSGPAAPSVGGAALGYRGAEVG